MRKRTTKIALLLGGTAMIFMAGPAMGKETVQPTWNCAECHQKGAEEIWGTLVPGSQKADSFQVQSGKNEIWDVRYDLNSQLKSMASIKDLADEKAVRVKIKAEGGNRGYAEEVSYKSNYKFHDPANVITINEVVELLKKSPEEGNYVIFDSRGHDNYIEGHLPNAVLLPHYQFQAYKERMPADKNTQIVAYCRGYG